LLDRHILPMLGTRSMGSLSPSSVRSWHAELLGLRRRDIDPMRGTLTVEVTRTKNMAGTMLEKPPKTDAGRRTLRVPAKVLPALISHLEAFVGSDPDALLLDGDYRSLRTAWDNARRKVGVTYRLHDLRHFGHRWLPVRPLEHRRRS